MDVLSHKMMGPKWKKTRDPLWCLVYWWWKGGRPPGLQCSIYHAQKPSTEWFGMNMSLEESNPNWKKNTVHCFWEHRNSFLNYVTFLGKKNNNIIWSSRGINKLRSNISAQLFGLQKILKRLDHRIISSPPNSRHESGHELEDSLHFRDLLPSDTLLQSGPKKAVRSRGRTPLIGVK